MSVWYNEIKEGSKMSKRKNNGKIFETNIKDSMPKEVWAYRPPDTGGGMMARFTSESLCDLIAFDTLNKELHLLELKSTVGTSMAFVDYETCMNYEAEVKAYNDYYESLTSKQISEEKEKLKQWRKDNNELRKITNRAMIKYHQIKSLLETEEEFGIKGYLLVTFISNVTTYAIPIKSFVEFWKTTTKKSINENDILDLVLAKKAHFIPQTNRGRSKINFDYDLSILFK